MNIVFVLVAAFPIGYFVRQRSVAVTAFLAADSFLFAFQTLAVLLSWMGGETGLGGAKAFGEFPTGLPLAYEDSEVIGYGLVNLVILVVGTGLTVLGNVVRSRRSADSRELVRS